VSPDIHHQGEQMDGPTVLRRKLGAELAAFRASRGMRAADVATEMGWSASKVSRIESGSVPLQDRDAGRLLALYGVDDPVKVKEFINLVRRSRQQGWWHAYGDALPDWLRTFIGLEDDASKIVTFQNELIPGLLQTEEYARQVIRTMNPSETQGEIEARVALRMERQRILERRVPPEFHAIIGEAVVRRVVGSPKVMQEQVNHLAGMAHSNSRVLIQVLPFSAGAHAAMGSTFSIFSFRDLPGSIAYSEAATSTVYTDRDAEIARHEDMFLRLQESSMNPGKSVSWLREVAKEYR